jgi:hypothetical protein
MDETNTYAEASELGIVSNALFRRIKVGLRE